MSYSKLQSIAHSPLIVVSVLFLLLFAALRPVQPLCHRRPAACFIPRPPAVHRPPTQIYSNPFKLNLNLNLNAESELQTAPNGSQPTARARIDRVAGPPALLRPWAAHAIPCAIDDALPLLLDLVARDVAHAIQRRAIALPILERKRRRAPQSQRARARAYQRTIQRPPRALGVDVF